MTDLKKQSAGIKLSGGIAGTLNPNTVIFGKGQNITNIDYENITINPLNFQYPIIKTPRLYDIENFLSSNDIYIADEYLTSKTDLDNNFQKKLIPNPSIIITDSNHISVDFSLSGWSNINNNYITTNYTNALDVWSIGCIFAELIGRAPLFPGDDYLD